MNSTTHLAIFCKVYSKKSKCRVILTKKKVNLMQSKNILTTNLSQSTIKQVDYLDQKQIPSTFITSTQS